MRLDRLLSAFSLAAAILVSGVAAPASAAPKRIVIVRHGEKQTTFKLCKVGALRSHAIANQYLGPQALSSPRSRAILDGQTPAAVFVITLHTLEFAVPLANALGQPVIAYSVLPFSPKTGPYSEDAQLNRHNREAVAQIFSDPQWNGKTLVLMWEHRHIADAALEHEFPGEKVTLRQLLGLDAFKDVPTTWPETNYDYFWVVDFDQTTGKATSFRAVKQVYTGKFAGLPENDWDTPEGLPKEAHCIP
ncbi:histidine phosphatase family protein [Segnochrobactrum spirostomi]|uniref:Histidine phosphatase family protein n=1 Tax=Segnochrobactrum spirostomi TaxID=2608987 RepID=A0A6A7Y643_9HYPH|nr:histidine phosphatase family protein [Segnochrobactrum spirostomi]MQT14256.1 histidine phosphatase family protein [Segnochrobactrum spirostomi]